MHYTIYTTYVILCQVYETIYIKKYYFDDFYIAYYYLKVQNDMYSYKRYLYSSTVEFYLIKTAG